jgi:hypothetical protein
LEGSDRFEGVEMSGESGVDDAFEDFGNEVEVRDWPVTGQFVGWKVILFKFWRDQTMFERGREGFLGDGEVDEGSDGIDKNIEAGLEKPGRKFIEGTGSVGGGKNGSSNFVRGGREEVVKVRGRVSRVDVGGEGGRDISVKRRAELSNFILEEVGKRRSEKGERSSRG